MCPLPAPVFQGFFLWWPLTVLMKQTRQAVHTFKQSILLRCLWTWHVQKWSYLSWIAQGGQGKQDGIITPWNCGHWRQQNLANTNKLLIPVHVEKSKFIFCGSAMVGNCHDKNIVFQSFKGTSGLVVTRNPWLILLSKIW